MDRPVASSSPTTSPFIDSALPRVPLSSPSKRDGRSSTDIIAFQLDDERRGYFDAPLATTAQGARVRPTGVPLVSPAEEWRSQETTSTDKLDKEFQDGEELILAAAEMEIVQSGAQNGSHSKIQTTEDDPAHEPNPKAIKRKRSTSPDLRAVTDKDLAAASASQGNDAWDYTEDAAYAASKFGGIAEYMRHKRMKLQIQNRAIAESRGGAQYPQIFKGLEIYINGYVRPSLETLREMIMMHGGTYIPYLDRKGMITHIIASNLTPSKFREFAKYKVVTPAWITDSVERGQLLEWKAYKLVPKGGGEEEGMRGGMGRFLARSQAPGQRGNEEREARGKQKEVEVVEDSEEEDQVPSPRKVPPPEEAVAQLDVPEETEKPTTKGPEPPEPPEMGPSNPTTPVKRPPLAPVFTKSPAPAPAPQQPQPGPAAEPGSPYPRDAPPPTTDQRAFERAHAMGWYATRTENPDAKRLMKSAEWREQHTAANEGFLEGYYQNSRLHHLSNWKAELKLLVAQAQSAAESTETVHSLAPGAKPIRTDDLSFTDTTLPKAQTRTTTIIGHGKGYPHAGDGDKIYFHVDFDAFFVSCGLATRPHLRGKPVVVCHSQGNQGSRADDRNQDAIDRGKGSTSEIASCSYEARAKGVKNGMSLGQARKLCPEVQTIPYEFETYKKFSLAFYTILMAYADELQAVSVDEALIDVTSQVHALATAPPEMDVAPETARGVGNVPQTVEVSPKKVDLPEQDGVTSHMAHREPPVAGLPASFIQPIQPTNGDTAPPEEAYQPTDWAKALAEKIRSDVRKATGCEVSIGIASNILLARLATRHAKPAGSFHLMPDAVPAFMAKLEVGDLPNFGWSNEKKIRDKFGTTNCGELLSKPKGVLQAVLGNKTGESLYNFIRGIDKRKLEPHKERKSVSAEVNYGIRFISTAEAEKFLLDLSKEVSKRLKAIDRLGHLVTLKVMVRHPDAPLEAPKFMGHGVCDVVNKSVVVSNAKGGATDDPTLIGEAVLSIYRAGKFDATELRGIGLQVQKLEGSGTVLPAVEEGQNRLDFAIKPPEEKLPAKAPPARPLEVMPPATIISIPSGNTEEHEDEIVAIEVDDDVIVTDRPVQGGAGRKTHVEAGRMSKFGRRAISVAPVSAAVLPPAPEEIDPEIWTLLPADDQRAYRQAWINQGHKIPHIFMEHRNASTSKTLNEPRLLFPNATKAAKAKHERQRSTSVRAGKKGRSESVFSIVKDSPKRRDVRSATPATSDVVDISGSSTPPRPLDYEDAELVDLGIDPQVFINLPADVQAEVYREAATSRTTRNHLTKRGVLVHPANAPGRSPRKQVRQVAIADVPTRPKMNGISDIEDIMNMVGEWMDRSYLHAPNPNEVKVIRKYLVRCVDTETGGLGGIQDATRVLGYWRRTCMRLWPKDQSAGRNEDLAAITTEASWRRAFRDIRDEVDALVQARFGGPLVLP